MGNDGGSIAKRDELVRTKASFEKVDPELLRQSLWTVCAISRQPLSPPVASDPLGRLYNKDAVVQHLLSRRHQNNASTPKFVDPIPHIRGLRDITELKLTPNPLFRPPSPTSGTAESSVYPFMCPLSDKQMDGKQRYVYIDNCGCAMSHTGLLVTVAAGEKDKLKQTPCPVCGKNFNAIGLVKAKQTIAVGPDVVTINPNEMEEAEMREAMEKTRAEQAARKKAKARTAGQASDKDTAQKRDDDTGDKAEKKRRKAEKQAERSKRIAELSAELAAEQ